MLIKFIYLSLYFGVDVFITPLSTNGTIAETFCWALAVLPNL
jgi:hypothetical protein